MLRLAPLFLPLERRLQTLAVMIVVAQFFLVGPISTIILVYLLFTNYYFITLLYAAWFVYDQNGPRTGGHLTFKARRLSIWKHLANFFPTKLIKTAELSPDKRYIFGCHPHGILSFSFIVNFATEATGFSELFKGVTVRLLTLRMMFWFPVLRDIVQLHGICSVESKSIDYILNELKQSVAVVVGGAQEVVDTSPQAMVWILKRRKGFVRMAIKNGVSLVPVVSFGENDLYNTLQNESLKRFQEAFKSIFTFAPPIIFGRGIFQYSFGIVPFRKQLVTIVGKPIDVEKNPNPTQEEIDKVHERYIRDLTQLYEENKAKYSYENVELKIK